MMEDCYEVRADSSHRDSKVSLISYFKFTRFFGLYKFRDNLQMNRIEYLAVKKSLYGKLVMRYEWVRKA